MSIGSKLAIVVLVLPISATLIVLALLYVLLVSSFQPFLLALVAGIPSAIGVVWSRLRLSANEKLSKVWEAHIQPIRGGIAFGLSSPYFVSDLQRKDLFGEIEWLTEHGKYSFFRLYPRDLVSRLRRLLEIGSRYTQQLDALVKIGKSEGWDPVLFIGLESLGLEASQFERMAWNLSPPQIEAQKLLWKKLVENHSSDVEYIRGLYRQVFTEAPKIIQLIEKFGTENGIVMDRSGISRWTSFAPPSIPQPLRDYGMV